jgi:RNase P protein component
MEGVLVRCVAKVERAPVPELRVGYAVSSKAYSAVWRNRLRRLMREAVAVHRERLEKALQRGGMSASVVFSFNQRAGTDVRRITLSPIADEIGHHCRRLEGSL